MFIVIILVLLIMGNYQSFLVSLGFGIESFDAKVIGINFDNDKVKVRLSQNCDFVVNAHLNMNNDNYKKLYDSLQINKTYSFVTHCNEIVNIEEPTKYGVIIKVDDFYELTFEDGKKLYKIVSNTGKWFKSTFFADNSITIEKDKKYCITYSLCGFCNGYKILTINPL